MLLPLVTGLLAGALMGWVLQHWDLCFHSMFAGAWRGDTALLRGWLLGVGLGSVGLSALFAAGWFGDLNQGLAFRPVANVVGGLVIGVGMVVARSCASGLFYKLGAGMFGCVVGIVGWVLGELAARGVRLGGPTVLGGGPQATIPHLVGVPRIVGSLVLLALALVVGLSGRRDGSWSRLGIALGIVLVLGWVLAGVGGASFGPSTVGASASVARGHPMWWLIGFLVGIVPGAFLSARRSGAWRPRGESGPRYLGLLAGGFLLGAGGWIAGGCNLGHGLSGAAQLNVSSWVVVLAMAAGVGLAGAVARTLSRAVPVPH